MFRKLRRLKGTAVLYTCGSLCAIFLLVNFNEDVKKLLQQQEFPRSGAQNTVVSISRQSRGDVRHEILRPPGPKGSLEEENASESDINPPKAPARNYSNESQEHITYFSDRPWFMWRGGLFPVYRSPKYFLIPPSEEDEENSLPLAHFFHEDNPNSDRIVEQLMYVIDKPVGNGSGSTVGVTPAPSDNISSAVEVVSTSGRYHNNVTVGNSSSGSSSGAVPSNSGRNNTVGSVKRRPRRRVKTILLYYGLGMSWGGHITSGRNVFLEQKCPVNACRLTGNRSQIGKADAVVFKDVFMNPKTRRRRDQLWLMYMLECPLNTQNFVDRNVFNMTATYRHDSDIVTPYEKWVYYDDNVRAIAQG